jgi:hypothetical protein
VVIAVLVQSVVVHAQSAVIVQLATQRQMVLA